MPAKRDEDEDDSKKPGRPKVLPPDLDKRHQLRCSSRDFAAWVKHSRRIGFPNVSAWLRKTANDAIRAASAAAPNKE